MSLALYDIVVPTFVGGLRLLDALLEKAAAHADANKIEPRELLEARLVADMFTFTQQVQTAADTARRGVDRLAGKEPSSVEDAETTFGELRERVAATISHVEGADRAAMEGAETREFRVDMGQPMDFTGRSYALGFALPNFLFHVSTAYDILRHNGVELGKRDFIAPFMVSVAAIGNG